MKAISTLLARLAALEARIYPTPGGVVVMRDGESAEQALTRAAQRWASSLHRRQNRPAGVLLVPGTLSPEAWCEAFATWRVEREAARAARH